MTAFLENKLQRRTGRRKIELLNRYMNKVLTHCDEDHSDDLYFVFDDHFDANHQERLHHATQNALR